MNLRLAGTLALGACIGVLGLAATINQFRIVDAVNAKLAHDDQFNHLGWFLPKMLNLHKQYRRLYPDGTLLRRQGILQAAMLFCTVLAGGFIGLGFLPMAFFGGFGALLLWITYFKY